MEGADTVMSSDGGGRYSDEKLLWMTGLEQ